MDHVLVALLRGINVGKAKRVAMADLRKVVEKLGYGDVKTLLNSGNVVFTSKSPDAEAAARRIEKGIEISIGVTSRVTVVSADDLAALVKKNPHAKIAKDPSRHLVAFYAHPAAARKIAPLLKRGWAPEAIAAGRSGAYMWCPESILDSPLFSEVARLMKDEITTRNWATVLKLEALTRRDGEA